ncbi:Insulin-induced protein family [Penicillium expansum]|uniref:Insulin-induced protein family n=1 Tax=Penicillium expansum TaxID=27334 RepID=A0A0A2ICU8_PENEN|nr:Insulin-induced protein family [Penicillium expansum]KGO38125.1 Insulin-induced protein family [Penicillium expansum]KGO53038.1 Insulin-induced protein family [Penicillium expansum]
MNEQPRILRPRPRRPFDLTPASTESSGPPTPAESTGPEYLNPQAETSNSTSVSRTGSVMNLTSSTLYGIYSPTAFDGFRDESSPWGTEANSPAAEFPPEPLQRAAEKSAIEPRRMALRRTRSRLSHGLFRGVILPQALSSVLLFGFGLAYGVITVHLHQNHWITPVKLENIHYYDSWQYLGFWGFAGIALGNLLPWLDSWREGEPDSKLAGTNEEESEDRTPSWVTVARSVGAFVGIAFAMRRLPWESTTQASLTLALANPVLWYLIDRTTTGFVLSTTVGLTGMGVVLGLKPELVPTSTGPSLGASLLNGTGLENVLGAGITQESIAVRTWVASVIFCACVCFGNVGRQLAIGAGIRDVMKP